MFTISLISLLGKENDELKSNSYFEYNYKEKKESKTFRLL